jgi:hypothetical protein
MSSKPFHLAWFLQGSSVQAWGEPWTGHIGQTWMQPELFLDLARGLERACFDYLLLEDSSYVGESYNGSTALYLSNAIAVPRQDPSVVAALMSTVTSRIGIVPTFGTYAYPPYLLARLMATLDQRLECGDRKLGLRGDEFRHERDAGARPAIRHGRRIHGCGESSVGFVGAGGDRRGPRIRRIGRSRQGPRGQLRRKVLQHPRSAELGSLPAGAAGGRPGRRLPSRPGILPRASPTRSSCMPRGSPG